MRSVDYQPRELTHACSCSDTEACDMCYVFNVNLTDYFDNNNNNCLKSNIQCTQRYEFSGLSTSGAHTCMFTQ